MSWQNEQKLLRRLVTLSIIVVGGTIAASTLAYALWWFVKANS